MAENSEAFLDLKNKAANIRKLQRFVLNLIKRKKNKEIKYIFEKKNRYQK